MTYAPTFALIPFLSLFIASSAFAAGTPYVSADRVALEAVRARAIREGKKVLIEMGAAWCGPCAVLETAFRERATELAPALDHYVQFHYEETLKEIPVIEGDFIPVEADAFPTFFALDPVTGAMAYVADDGFENGHLEDFVQPLLDFATTGSVFPNALAQYEALLSAGAKFGTDAADSRQSVLKTIALNLALTGSLADTVAFAKRLESDAAAHPAQFLFDGYFTLESLKRMSYAIRIELGSTFEEMRALDPTALGESEDLYVSNAKVILDIPLKALLHREGPAAAAAFCRIAAPKLSDPTDVAQTNALCVALDFWAGDATKEAVRAYLIGLSPKETKLASRVLGGLAGASGNYDLALSIENDYFAEMIKDYVRSPVLKARLTASHDARIAAFTAGRPHP